jgi:UDPglucose--hexose-1-phosphate uridylyltransferase
MEFKRLQKDAVLINPQKDNERRTIPIQIRKDPLTGRSSRICHFMKLKWQIPDLSQLVAGTEKFCPFCPDKVLSITPAFAPEILPEGRLIADDKVLFPNLAPYDSIAAVATLGKTHFVPITGFSPETIAAGFHLAIDFFRRLEAIGHPESVHHLINWNYMPPSGSSIIHPHLQVFATSTAPNLLREELAAARAYTEKNGSNYWDDLVTAEIKAGERFLASIGRTHWMCAFAPLGVAGDVVAVVEDVCSLLDLSETDLLDLSQGLTRAMAACHRLGLYSFNMNFFPGRPADPSSRLHLVFSPRTYFNPALGTPDVGALQKLYNESVCMEFPEKIRETLMF